MNKVKYKIIIKPEKKNWQYCQLYSDAILRTFLQNATLWTTVRFVAMEAMQEKVKVKEADLYSAFIEVPDTQGAQVRITQYYLQTTPYLPLPRKHSPDGASQTEVADI